MASGRPLTLDELGRLFDDKDQPDQRLLLAALEQVEADYQSRPLELKKVASGYRLQVREAYSPWVSRLFEERPGRYSRAFLETLAIIAYRQPATRGEIEDIRGVAVSSGIIKTMLEREWIEVIGHKEVPGRPALFGTTPFFLDYFGLTSLSELPPLQDFIDQSASDSAGVDRLLASMNEPQTAGRADSPLEINDRHE
ncbi:MAG: SMC-Scp complex subunit ScpB [Gammaproteobacteria bacterium]|nr:SMC-Scp complex subunit ScpB [Gammaproteobacteria bacterium]NBT43379.1 SMC-Scp complex subunit ScpB [Gammaproteobacteria bacterium]NBY22376.1 SMC-Scp complex subunit ScpB [Gammaproteobacteria bacterium]NDE33249.1 SMC-Scp complex subunit ScpB [Gammaproteobacteria bacterium]NDE55360.1 SMC-Scp complex subunit ScpB [Gammaproteobacteria bacterium]